MRQPSSFRGLKFDSPTVATMALSILLALAAIPTQAQTFKVIESFSGRNGAQPYAGLTPDGAGNFYGTTLAGGNMGCNSRLGCGTVFELSATSGSWTFTKLYNFTGGTDGWYPNAPVVIGPDGALYGTTEYGGYASSKQGYGTVFKLTPPATDCGISCPWTHTILYTFTDASDGAYPGTGPLTFDSAGNIYGTTEGGGLRRAPCSFEVGRCGVVYKLTPSGDSWTESVLYSFTGGLDGYLPVGSVTFDKHGNILGTTSEGGAYIYGTV